VVVITLGKGSSVVVVTSYKVPMMVGNVVTSYKGPVMVGSYVV